MRSSFILLNALRRDLCHIPDDLLMWKQFHFPHQTFPVNWQIFLRASVWSKNKWGRAPRAPFLDSPLTVKTFLAQFTLRQTRACLVYSYLSSLFFSIFSFHFSLTTSAPISKPITSIKTILKCWKLLNHENYLEFHIAFQCSEPVRRFGFFLPTAGLSKTQTWNLFQLR